MVLTAVLRSRRAGFMDDRHLRRVPLVPLHSAGTGPIQPPFNPAISPLARGAGAGESDTGINSKVRNNGARSITYWPPTSERCQDSV